MKNYSFLDYIFISNPKFSLFMKAMKVSALLMCLGVFSLMAENAHSQNSPVTINRSNESIQTILSDIESQTEFLFIYDNDVNVKAEASLQVKNEPVSDVLTELFKDTTIDYVVKGNHIILSPNHSANDAPSSPTSQNKKTVTGTVKDVSGEPLVGVSILIKGTTTGTFTDLDGAFLIEAEDGDILEVSYIGFTTVEMAAQFGRPLAIILEQDAQLLEETIVVGYGVQKKSSVTGAISSVRAEDLSNRSATSIEGGLQGKTAGVQIVTTSGAPGAEASIRVRGYGSNSSSVPLYVVDGLRTTNIGNIDPSDIESMEVLKDAASAAIYGAQAGNGVILITTKKAAQGVHKITYDMQYVNQRIARFPEVMNAEEWIEWVTQDDLIKMEKINQNWDGVTDINMADHAFETAHMHRHNLSFSGANNQGSLYTSVSYLDNDGPLTGDKDSFQRITASINADYNIMKWLKISTNNQLGKSTIRSAAGGRGGSGTSFLNMAVAADPLTPITYAPENVNSIMQTLLAGNHPLLTDADGNYYGISPYQQLEAANPYLLLDSADSETETINVHGTTSIDIKPLKSLVITGRVGYDINTSQSYSVTWPHWKNSDTGQDYVTINAGNNSVLAMQYEAFVNYNEKFNKFNVGAMAGASFSSRNTFGVSGNIQGKSGDIGITKNDPDYAYFAYKTGAASQTINGGERLKYAQLSYFGRLNLDYDNKYFLQASVRADAADTSILPTDNKWGYYPAVSGGWTISNEKFFKSMNAKFINHLKLRASWGQNGSIAGLGNYLYSASISSNDKYPFSDNTIYEIGSIPSSTGNPSLKWETSEQLDLGLDLRLFGNKLTLVYDYYIKQTKDLIIRGIRSSNVVGNTLSPVNAGNVRNAGHEIEISWKDKIGDFSYGISGNVATLKNEVTYLHESLSRVAGGQGGQGSGVTTYFEKGYPMWYMRGYNYLGVDSDTGDPIFEDVDGNDIINDDDMVMVGSGIPDVTFGLTLNLRYKAFDLLVFGNGSAGNEVTYAAMRSYNNLQNTLKHYYDNRWTPENRDARYPRPAMMYDKVLKSSAMVYDGSFFKIKQIQMGFNVPTKWLDKIRVKAARLYVSLDDMFVFTSYPSFDPEVSMNGSSLGIDYAQYPSYRKIVFGLNITL